MSSRSSLGSRLSASFISTRRTGSRSTSRSNSAARSMPSTRPSISARRK